MTTRQRIAVTAGCALVSAVTILGEVWSTGHTSQGWAIANLAAYGLALVGAFFVNRWWALSPALSTVAVAWLGVLIYQPAEPWNQETVALPADIWIVVVVSEIVVPAAFLALGLLARRLWDHFRGEFAPKLSGLGR